MAGLRTTNWLLAGIFGLLAMQVWGQMDRTAQADTFQLDSCITRRIADTPQQYVHVVAHEPAESR